MRFLRLVLLSDTYADQGQEESGSDSSLFGHTDVSSLRLLCTSMCRLFLCEYSTRQSFELVRAMYDASYYYDMVELLQLMQDIANHFSMPFAELKVT